MSGNGGNRRATAPLDLRKAWPASPGDASDLSSFDVSFIAVGDGRKVRAPLLPFADYSFEQVSHIRNPPAHTTQKHMPGYLWVSKGERLLVYESRLAMKVMQALDYHREVVEFSSEPFRLHRKGKGDGARQHVPDLFVRLRDGRAIVIDVGLDAYRDLEKRARGFDLARRACRVAGFGYLLQGELEPTVEANLDALSGFRRAPAALQTHQSSILEHTRHPVSLQALLAALPDPEVPPCVFHLIWGGTLDLNIRKPITGSTQIRRLRADASS